MRIAIVSPAGLEGRGGIERIIKYLVSEFDESHHDIRWDVIPTRLTTIPVLKHISSAISLMKFGVSCLTHRYDVVHINVAPRGSTWRKMFFASVAKLFKIPVVLHLHGSGYDQFYGKLSAHPQKKVRRFFAGVAGVVVLGTYWFEFVKNVLGVDTRRIAIIPNGAPLPAKFPPPENAIPHIVTLGRLGDRKGTDVLLKALATLPSDLPWLATIAGDGEVERFVTMATDLGLSSKIRFPGWLDEHEALDLLTTADVFVLPSRAENQPVAIIEAMARNLPVISTNIGAIPEQVNDGVSGILVEAGEVAPLSEAVNTLISNPAIRIAMGANGYQIYQNRYSISKCASDFVAQYRKAANVSADA